VRFFLKWCCSDLSLWWGQQSRTAQRQQQQQEVISSRSREAASPGAWAMPGSRRTLMMAAPHGQGIEARRAEAAPQPTRLKGVGLALSCSPSPAPGTD
jgi:hypothetical protein